MSQIKQSKVPFFSLYRLASKKDIAFITIGTLSAVGNGVMQPLFGQLFGEMAQKFTPGNTPDQVFEGSAVLAGYFILVGVLSFFLSCSMLYCWINVGEKQAINIRYSYFKSMIQQDISYFDSINSNELSSKVALDCFKIQQAIGEKLCMYIYTMSMLAGSLIISFIRGWQIALVSCIIIPIVWYTCKFLTWVSSGVVKKTSQEYQQAGGVAEQALSSIRTIKSLNGEQFETDKFSSLITKAYQVSIKYSIFTGIAYGKKIKQKVFKITILFKGIQNMMLFFDFSLTFWVGSLFIENQITNQNMQRDYLFSDIIVVFLSIVLTSFRLGGATDSVNYFQEAQVSGFEVFSIIEKKPVIQQNENGIKFDDKVKEGQIQFENVKFAYPSRNGLEIFKGLNFQLQANKKTAFVGKSGCGKSTIIQLIERFYDPIEGNIYIDGVNIKDIQLNSLRLAIGYVSQEPILFATTIRENLRYSKPDATEEEMIEALKKANVWSFIENQEKKLDTFVGQNGTQLSGGQKQRICIARAILKKPKILLLDEATSALDTKNEALIQKTLDEVTQGITTVVIAHRLSTIQSADEIIVIDEGKIMERGSHQELMDKNGLYYEFVKKQEKIELSNQKNNQIQLQNQKKTNSDELINLNLNKQTSLFTANSVSVQNLNIISQKDLLTQRQLSSNQETNIPSQYLITNLYTETCQLNDLNILNEKQFDKIVESNQNEPKQYSFFQMLKKLLTYDKKQTINAFLGMFFSVGNGIAYPFCGWVFGNIASILLNPNVEHFREKADLYTIYFAVIGLVDLVSLTLQYFFQSRISETLTLTLRQNLFKKFLKMPVSWFDKPSNNSGALSSSLQIDCKQVNVLVGTTLTFNIANISSLICAILLGLSADWRTTLVGLCLMPLIVLANILFAVRMNIFSSKMNQSSEDTAQLINESSCHIRTVASLGNPLCFCENFKAILSKNLSDINKSAFQAGMAIGFTNLALFGVYGIIFICGAAFHRSYEVEIRDILVSILCLMFAALGIGKNTEFMGDAGASLVSANKIFQTLELQDEVEQNKGSFETDFINGELSFENVSFKYPERDAYVLKNVSFKIPAKSKIAFVGPSGSGKTSIIQLIQRFYSNYSGKILLDGIDIKKYNLKKYRSFFGVVQQEPVLFNGTIQQNMIYNTQNVSNIDLINASALANTQEFIQGFEEGFQKQVGQRGIQISGGQKQRIAIGRVILKQPQIMLLDEATSALDSQNENQVQKSLNNVMQNKTSISVAHRISTIKDSDIIFVLENGQIVEQGDYNQLMSLKNHFFKLQQNLNNEDTS
ncbi:hypothetical protein ABPG74_022572 [Tetrahymena malaccensis]